MSFHQSLKMPSTPEIRYVNSMVKRMLKVLEDVPEFVSFKKILLRPDTREAAAAIVRLNGLLTPSPPRHCGDFLVFGALLGHVTLEEKARHLVPLVEVFKFLLPRHQSLSSTNSCSYLVLESDCVSKFLTLYVEAVRNGEYDGTSGDLVRFVEWVMATIPVELGTLLRRMDPNAMDHLLTCFSDERFHTGGIKESDFLMKWMKCLFVHSMNLAVLIRHGFKYSFHEDYYTFCGMMLYYKGFFPVPVNYAFLVSGNLRMQLALEILVQLICDEGGRNRELLRTLWQSLPEPFITADELYHLTKNFFVRGSSVLDNACARYPDLIPGVPREKQPRSLKHLARVQIRESMVRAHSIGEKAVRSLGLPKLIQDYLWKLEEF